ncbi:hypothetical protein AAFF_G00162000 [Aldrovandia affinis]|uniref:Uncharacterized protein n=1 Tax=Aldrovandia affinis TaxID=143900 RepID=A0AAD7RMH1_9TELE|nr:hypothetical protein AAFF_G00162000 [Aldrovandia affinis]
MYVTNELKANAFLGAESGRGELSSFVTVMLGWGDVSVYERAVEIVLFHQSAVGNEAAQHGGHHYRRAGKAERKAERKAALHRFTHRPPRHPVQRVSSAPRAAACREREQVEWSPVLGAWLARNIPASPWFCVAQPNPAPLPRMTTAVSHVGSDPGDPPPPPTQYCCPVMRDVIGIVTSYFGWGVDWPLGRQTVEQLVTAECPPPRGADPEMSPRLPARPLTSSSARIPRRSQSAPFSDVCILDDNIKPTRERPRTATERGALSEGEKSTR